MNPYLALVITLAIALIEIRSLSFAADRGWIESHLSRKLIHIVTGPLFILCWLLFPDVWYARWLAALVVDESDEQLAAIAARVKPDFFQLHGKETPARAADIRARFGISIIKALPAAEQADLSKASAYDDVAEMVLFDAVPAADAARPGGHGAAFDWRILQGRNFARPWFLAGGLTPENVARAIAVSGAKMVDVSSGVESAPGVKNETRIAAFVAAAKHPVRA